MDLAKRWMPILSLWEVNPADQPSAAEELETLWQRCENYHRPLQLFLDSVDPIRAKYRVIKCICEPRDLFANGCHCGGK